MVKSKTMSLNLLGGFKDKHGWSRVSRGESNRKQSQRNTVQPDHVELYRLL